MTAIDRRDFESTKKTVDSESKATEPITKELRKLVGPDSDGQYFVTVDSPKLLEIADRIDAEHERRMDGAVRVVRCKECTWFRSVDGMRLCVRNRNVVCLVDWDDYCSAGVRWVKDEPPMSEAAKRVYYRLMDLSGGGVSE